MSEIVKNKRKITWNSTSERTCISILVTVLSGICFTHTHTHTHTMFHTWNHIEKLLSSWTDLSLLSISYLPFLSSQVILTEKHHLLPWFSRARVPCELSGNVSSQTSPQPYWVRHSVGGAQQENTPVILMYSEVWAPLSLV
jgi:hypothetical protein